jgi:hypothetical protein
VFDRRSAGFEKPCSRGIESGALILTTGQKLPIVKTTKAQMIFVSLIPDYEFTFLRQVEKGLFIGPIPLGHSHDFCCSVALYWVIACSDKQYIAQIDKDL